MSGDAPKTFLWSLQGLVALVFTLVVLAISAALIGYNHTQLTTLTFQDAEEDFQRITNNIRGELSGSLRVAGSVLDTASLTVDGDLPLEDLAKVLTSVLENLDQVLPAAMGIFIGRADGTHVVVQSLDDSRPPEIGTDLPASAAYVFMLVENSDKGQTARWIVIDRNGRELRRIPPQPTTFDPRKRPWYGPALAATDTILTPPYRPLEKADLHAICAEVAEFAAPLALAQGKNIALSESDAAVWVYGNPEMLSRAIRNLVENAINYSPPGTTVEIVVEDGGMVRVLDEGPENQGGRARIDLSTVLAARSTADRGRRLGSFNRPAHRRYPRRNHQRREPADRRCNVLAPLCSYRLAQNCVLEARFFPHCGFASQSDGRSAARRAWVSSAIPRLPRATHKNRK